MKVPRSTRGSGDVLEQARAEYGGLCELHAVFPQDAAYGTLTPVACVEFAGGGAVVTRAFEGSDLLRCARFRDAAGLHELFAGTGALLRRLHDCSPRGVCMQPIVVADRLAYLNDSYGVVLRQWGVTRKLCERLEGAAAALRDVPVRSAWGHGDFKPENVLCDGRRQVVLDTRLAFNAAVIFDIASFLNHIDLSRQASAITRAGVRVDAAFLAGYGLDGADELRALRWARLYFMLVYLGRYARRGLPSRIFANRWVAPLARRLAVAV